MSAIKRFNDPLSDEDLYWLGYLQADGHISSNGTLYFAQKHKEPVEAFAHYIGKDNVAHAVKSSTYGIQEVFSIGTSQPNLIKLGLKNEIRDDIYISKHFWRGMIDGDGCIVAYDNAGPHMNLCGRKEDIDKFRDFVENLGLKSPTIVPRKTILYARLAGETAAYLLWFLYYNQFSSLKYKKDRAIKAMAWRAKYPLKSSLSSELREEMNKCIQ